MRVIAILLALACGQLSIANAVAEQVAPEAYQTCVACHGIAGEGNVALGAPALAGQQADYLQRQLENFKTGRRGADPRDTGGMQMKAMVAAVAEVDIPVLATYLSVLPIAPRAEVASSDMRNGSNYYQANCGACHGGKGQGNSGLNSPNLAILDTAYLKKQMENFQNGLRGSDPEDRFGMQMKMMSTTLPSKEHLADVLAFIESLGAP